LPAKRATRQIFKRTGLCRLGRWSSDPPISTAARAQVLLGCGRREKIDRHAEVRRDRKRASARAAAKAQLAAMRSEAARGHELLASSKRRLAAAAAEGHGLADQGLLRPGRLDRPPSSPPWPPEQLPPGVTLGPTLEESLAALADAGDLDLEIAMGRAERWAATGGVSAAPPGGLEASLKHGDAVADLPNGSPAQDGDAAARGFGNVRSAFGARGALSSLLLVEGGAIGGQVAAFDWMQHHLSVSRVDPLCELELFGG
jgi:hypothetical protein